jgi:arylamine N-acetyltransferase
MFDAGIPSHGTAIVTIGGTEWLVDSSMLYGAPLRLDPGGRTAIDHPTWHTTAEPAAEGWLFQFARNEDAGHIPCRTISPDAVTHAFCASRYEWSRENSPFNTQVYLRRNRGDTMLSYAVGTRLARTGEAVESTDLAGDDLAAALVDEMGLSAAIVEQLVAVLDLS